MAGMADQSHDVVTFKVGDNTFVSGLIWRQLLSPRTYMSEAKQIGRELQNMEMVAIRKGRKIQAGFAPKQPDAKSRKAMRKMYSLAACVAPVLGEDGIGVFEIPDGRFAFVAVRKGAILPGLDVVGDRAKMVELLNETFSQMTASTAAGKVTVVAPASFGADANPRSLEDVLQGEALLGDHRLQPLRFGLTRQEIAVYGGAIAGLTLMSLGATAGYRYYEQQKLDEAAERDAADQAQRNASADAKARAAQIRGWQHLPETPQVLIACNDVLHDTDADLGGWRFQKASCVVDKQGNRANDYVEVVYQGGTTSVASFLRAVKSLGAMPRIQFDSQGIPNGTLRRGLRLLDTSGGWLPLTNTHAQMQASQLPSADSTIASVVDVTQSIPNGIAGLDSKPIQWTPPKENPKAPPPEWREFNVTIKSNLTPYLLLEGLPLDGFQATDIDAELPATGSQLTWTLKGTIYGR